MNILEIIDDFKNIYDELKIIEPINNVILVTNVAKLLFMLWAIVSTSFVTRDNPSPVSCVSKYFNGNLLIFLLISVLNFLAKLLDTVVSVYDSI